MAGWFIPAVKAILPHVGPIVASTLPAFTRRRGVGPDDDDERAGVDARLLQQQIGELQAAASQNAANVKELAEQLQRTVIALEQAAQAASADARRTRRLSIAATTASAIAVVLAIAALFVR